MAPRKTVVTPVVAKPAARRTPAQNIALGKTAAARKPAVKKSALPKKGSPAPAPGFAPAVPAVSSPFLYALGQVVEIAASREEGIVRARGEFHHGPNQYMLAYTTAQGAYATIWIDEDLLKA